MIGKIKIAPKNVKEFNGRKSISFQIEEVEGWFNFEAEEEKLKNAISLMTKGSEVEFEPNNFNTTNDLTIKSTPKTDKPTEKRWQDEMNTFEDLIDAGHKKGIKSLTSNIVHLDLTNKILIFKVTLTLKGGAVFEAHGDASINNVGQQITPHYIRMAETRAVARVLRFATNNGKTCEIETEHETGINEEGLL